MPKSPAKSRFKIALACILSVCAILVISLWAAREPMNRWKCATNLSAIGQALFLYANDNHGALPPDLGTLAWDEDAVAIVFICPSSDTTVPSDLSPAQLIPWVNAHSDYVYLGAGRTLAPAPNIPNNPKIILAYERETNHHGSGMNVLFADGTVAWMSVEAAHQAVALSRARCVTTQPSSQP
jgi:prepilin-type processing-associated H-X9-DG protein